MSDGREGSTLAWAAAAATAVLAAAFVASGLGNVPISLLAAVCLILLPVLALLQRPPPISELRAHRFGFYTASIVLLGVVALLTLVVARGLSHPAGLRLVWPSAPGHVLGPAALLTLAGVVVAYVFRGLSRAFGWCETEVVRGIMPATRPEKGMFALLAATAGVSEELVFRGFLPAFIMPWSASYLLGALPVAVVFGFLHAYQGPHGIVRTAVIGAILAVGVAWTGSLWPSIFAHAALDLLFGLVLVKSLLGEPPAEPATKGVKWT